MDKRIKLIVHNETKTILRDKEYNIRSTLQRVYGFNINYNQSASQNAVRVLDDEPTNILQANNKNIHFHNLCPPEMVLPVGIKSLLGLGLKFCIERPRPYQDLCTALLKFKRDLDIRGFLIDNDMEDPDDPTHDGEFNRRLYINNPDWNPDRCGDPMASAFTKFETIINRFRRRLPTWRRFNLRPIQRRCIKQIHANKSIIIHGSDKGLGPYVAPKPTYIKQSLTEHMLNPINYVRLSATAAEKELKEQKDAFLTAYSANALFIDDDHIKYFDRNHRKHSKEGSRTPLFYALWKVHKDKTSVRPVISSCGSFAEIYSIFLDEMLKRLVQDVLSSYIISSDQLVNKLSTQFPAELPPGVMLFSIDAVGMYINIGTEHALKVIGDFIRLYADEIDGLHLPQDFILAILKIVMERNIFKFGDTFWKQINGTAMGTSCAVNYAFLYLALLEMVVLMQEFKTWMLFYGRFIDDGFGLWDTQKEGSSAAWEAFLARLNDWGDLKWTTTGHVRSLVFLDLTVYINDQNRLEFKTFRKEMNLNIYLPPNSAHPPDVIRSIIFGRVRAYYLHNTHHQDFVNECTTLTRNLIHCGWKWKHLRSHFTDVFNILTKQGKKNLLHAAMKTRREKEAAKPSERLLVFRLPYHPRGVQRRDVRTAYRESGLEIACSNRRFICAQLRATNLRDRVCRTALESQPNESPGDFLSMNP